MKTFQPPLLKKSIRTQITSDGRLLILFNNPNYIYEWNDVNNIWKIIARFRRIIKQNFLSLDFMAKYGNTLIKTVDIEFEKNSVLSSHRIRLNFNDGTVTNNKNGLVYGRITPFGIAIGIPVDGIHNEYTSYDIYVSQCDWTNYENMKLKFFTRINNRHCHCWFGDNSNRGIIV